VPLRIVFAGTPEFAVPSLNALLTSDHAVVAVYTQPDRPAGRGRRAAAGPVKRVAVGAAVPVRQPHSLQGVEQELAQLSPDVMVVIAYGMILPAAVLAVPRLGCINVHASLLPRWRGAAPIQRAIEAGDPVAGVTIMQMDAGLDTGAMLAQAQTPVRDDDTGGSLHDRLAQLGAEALIDTLARLEQGAVTAVPQDNSAASYAPKLSKQEAQIRWDEPAVDIARRVRAFNPWPVAWTTSGLGVLRIWSATAVEGDGAAPGSVLKDGDHIRVATGTGLLEIDYLQAPGGRVLSAAEFLRGHPLSPGTRLGGT
jgi:methionyl-tRNA formyltransferase